MTQPCARRAHRHPPSEQHPTNVGKIYPIQIYIRKCTSPPPCARRAHRHPPTWIYSANNCGVLFSWGVSVCPSSTGLDHVHFFRYVFLLDIFCQHLWGVVRLGGVHLYCIYSANNCGVLFSWGLFVCPSGTRLGHVHVLRYTFVLDIFCQQL